MSLYSDREALLMEKNARLEMQLQNKDLQQEVKNLQLQNKDLQQEVENLRMHTPVPAGKSDDQASHIALSTGSSGRIANLQRQIVEKDATTRTITGAENSTSAEFSPTSADTSRSEAQTSSSGPPLRKSPAEASPVSSNTTQSVNQDRNQIPEVGSTPGKFQADNTEPIPPPQMSYSQAIQRPRGQAPRRAMVSRGPNPSTPTHSGFLAAKETQEKPAAGAHEYQFSQQPNRARGHGVSKGQSDSRRHGNPPGHRGSRSNKGLKATEFNAPVNLGKRKCAESEVTGKESFRDKIASLMDEVHAIPRKREMSDDEMVAMLGDPLEWQYDWLESEKKRFAGINSVSSAENGPQSTDGTKDSSVTGPKPSNSPI